MPSDERGATPQPREGEAVSSPLRELVKDAIRDAERLGYNIAARAATSWDHVDAKESKELLEAALSTLTRELAEVRAGQRDAQAGQAALDDALRERDEARAWKESALTVLREWDAVYAAMGSPGTIGESKAVAALREVGKLRRCEDVLRLVDSEDWAGMIALAKTYGIPHNWDHPHNEPDYILEGDHSTDARYVYPSRAALIGALARAALAPAQEVGERTYPCDDCGKPRTASEGGTTFTVCEECMGKRYGRPPHPYTGGAVSTPRASQGIPYASAQEVGDG